MFSALAVAQGSLCSGWRLMEGTVGDMLKEWAQTDKNKAREREGETRDEIKLGEPKQPTLKWVRASYGPT